MTDGPCPKCGLSPHDVMPKKNADEWDEGLCPACGHIRDEIEDEKNE